MMRAFGRALVCVVVCSSLTGCGSAAGKMAGAFAVAAAASVLATAASSSSSSRSGGDHRHGAVASAPVRPEHEARVPATCEAKRREFRWVWGSSRRLPPQLQCTEDGDFGGPSVYGAQVSVGQSEEDE